MSRMFRKILPATVRVVSGSEVLISKEDEALLTNSRAREELQRLDERWTKIRDNPRLPMKWVDSIDARRRALHDRVDRGEDGIEIFTDIERFNIQVSDMELQASSRNAPNLTGGTPPMQMTKTEKEILDGIEELRKLIRRRRRVAKAIDWDRLSPLDAAAKQTAQKRLIVDELQKLDWSKPQPRASEIMKDFGDPKERSQRPLKTYLNLEPQGGPAQIPPEWRKRIRRR